MPDEHETPASSGPISLRNGWFGLTTPLGVFGAFAALVELGLIAGAIFIEGPLQWIMIVFAMVAFFYIARTFFDILRNSPGVLYTPGHFGAGTEAHVYAEIFHRKATGLEMNKQSRQLEIAVRKAVLAAVRPEAVTRTLSGPSDTITSGAVDRAVTESLSTVTDRIVEEITESTSIFFALDKDAKQLGTLQQSLGNQFISDRVSIRYVPNMWIGELIQFSTYAYSDLGLELGRRSYGVTWIMRDRRSGKCFDNVFLRDVPNTMQLLAPWSVEDIGMKPGMVLEPVPISPPTTHP